MSSFEDAVIQRIKQLEREVERLQKWERAADLGLGKLSDPNADRVLFWDESAGALKWLTVDGIVGTDLGVWSAWTPTITYGGGTTNPTSFTVTARYTRIGKLVVCVITGTLTRGSGNRTYINFTPPITIAKDSGGSATHTFQTDPLVVPCYISAGKLTINTGTWTSDGYLWSIWIYETS